MAGRRARRPGQRSRACSPRSTTASASRRCSAASARPTRSPTRSVRCDRCPPRCTSWRCRSRSRVTVAPQLVESAQRVRRARKLRGDASRRSPRGPRASRCRSCTTRSTARSGSRPRWTRAVTAAVVRPAAARPPHDRRAAARRAARPLPGYVRPARHLHARGCSACRCSRWASRCRPRDSRSAAGASSRTQYRPDPWRLPEWGTASAGVDRGGDRDRGQRPRRERPQPFALPARVADPAVVPVAGILSRARRPSCAHRRRRSKSVRPAAAARDTLAATGGSCRVIRFEHVTITYAGRRPARAARRRPRRSPPASCASSSARTGTGKSTLLGAINGLVPHFTGGTLRGRVTVDGRDTRDAPAARARRRRRRRRPRTRSRAASPTRSRKSSPTGWSSSRSRPASCASGSRRRSTCSASPSCATARCTSCRAASCNASRSARCSPRTRRCSCSTSRRRRSTRPARKRCWPRSPGWCTTSASPCVMAEHRLERVVQYADRVVYLPGDGTVVEGEPGRRARTLASVVPPIVELGRRAGWQPLPLSVRDARRRRARARRGACRRARRPPCPTRPRSRPDETLRARGIVVRYGPVVAVRDVDLDLRGGRDRRAHGPQRHGKVVAAVGAARDRGPCERPCRRRRRGPGRARTGAGPAPRRAGPAEPVGPALPRLGRRGARAGGRRGPRANRHDASSRSIASRPASTTTRTHAISPRASGSRSCSRSSSRRRRSCCCSTSRRAGSTTGPSTTSGASSRDLADAGHSIVVSTHDVEFVATTAHRVHRDGRGRDRRRRTDRRRHRRVARVRAAGREDPRAAALAHRRAARAGRRVRSARGRAMSSMRSPAAVRIGPRTAVALGIASVFGVVVVLLAVLRHPGIDAGLERRGAPDLRGSAAARARGGARAGVGGRPRRQGARAARRALGARRGAAPARRGHRRRRADLLPGRSGRSRARTGLRLQPRLHDAVRVRTHHRRASGRGCRTRCSRARGSDWAPDCFPRNRTARDLDARRVRRAVGVPLRPAAEPLVLAVHPGRRHAAVVRARRVAGRRTCTATWCSTSRPRSAGTPAAPSPMRC